MMWAKLKQHSWEWRGVFSVAPTIAGITTPNLIGIEKIDNKNSAIAPPPVLQEEVISLLLIGASLVGGSYIAFLADGWWIPVVPPVLALLGSATAMTSYIANGEGEDRSTVMTLFKRHVTPQLAETIWCDRHQLLTEGRLRGCTMTVTVLFTDFKGFSRILLNKGTYQYVQDKFSTQQIGCVRLKGREQGTVVYQVLHSPTVNENPEGSISVNVAITLAEERSLSRTLREDSFSTTDYHPSSLTGFSTGASLFSLFRA